MMYSVNQCYEMESGDGLAPSKATVVLWFDVGLLVVAGHSREILSV